MENRKYNHFTENLLKINDNKLPKKIADLIEKHKTVNEEKTNLDKIPTGVKYYLLDWKDRNMDEYIRQYGEQKLRDLSLEQLFELYSYVTTKDGAAMSRLASGK